MPVATLVDDPLIIAGVAAILQAIAVAITVVVNSRTAAIKRQTDRRDRDESPPDGRHKRATDKANGNGV